LLKILTACECRWILAGGNVGSLLDEIVQEIPWRDQLSIGWLDSERPSDLAVTFTLNDVAGYSGEPRDYQNTPDKPAHILFTSGSTGDPKGVVISHANVVHCAEWAARHFSIDTTDRLSCHPPLYFDMSFMDIFAAAASGAELHLVPSSVSVMPNGVAEFIRESGVTQWFSVPSVLSYMAQFDRVRQDDFPALRRVLWAGDVLPTPALIYWMQRLPHVAFTNLYGPTETTIVSSIHTMPACPEDPRALIPIGIACDGEELLVLDGSMQPAPVEDIGEIYIGGEGVAAGYWRQPELTDAVFVPDPRNPSRRLYKTGDLGRLGKDGLVYFLGRRDSQIKSRGYRIELGEIEAALNTIAGLKGSAVVAVPSEGFEGNVICCAYCTDSEDELNPVVLRRELSQMLPAYMLPTQWLAMPALPVNANGKVDRRKLREVFVERIEGQSSLATRQADRSPFPLGRDQIVIGMMTYAILL
jgi:amino acid adenylation domain-containing protein